MQSSFFVSCLVEVVDNCMLALEEDQWKVVDNLIKNMIKNFSDYLKFFLE